MDEVRKTITHPLARCVVCKRETSIVYPSGEPEPEVCCPDHIPYEGEQVEYRYPNYGEYDVRSIEPRDGWI